MHCNSVHTNHLSYSDEGSITMTNLNNSITLAIIFGMASILSLATTMTSAFATTEAFVATLSGDKEVPPVETQATGTAGFTQPHLSNMSYGVRVNNIEGVTGSAHTSRSGGTERTYNRNIVQG